MSKKKNPNAFEAYGITILHARHAQVRTIKRQQDQPVIYGHRLWGSSLLLMDYCRQRQLISRGDRVLDAGCGWGLTAIYAAANHGAQVTAVDADKSVFPYVHLHADINDVQVITLQRRFEKIRISDLAGYDWLLGGDVCFWDELVDTWYRLVARAFRTGVCRVVLADPGRSSFHELSEKCRLRWGADSEPWAIRQPRAVTGYILDIQNRRP